MAGWVYPAWRGGFYPSDVTQKAELAYASRHVTSIELNGSFYSLQKPSSWRSWRDATPDDFVFSVKAPRFITHMRRLKHVDEPLANFFASGILALGPKLGAILWQLPVNLVFEPEVLDRFLAGLPRTTTAAVALAQQRSERMTGKEHLETDAERPVRHALEVRHASFDTPNVIALAREHNVAVVYGDSGGKFPVIDAATADFRYARLHADVELYPDGWYEPAELDRWAATINGWLDSGQDAYVYFDNDTKVRSPIDAMSLIERFGQLD
jgi:uncharacterized protein YecE (DUF72 family)